MSRRKMTLGIATVQDIDKTSDNSRLGTCGLIKWCYSMHHLVSQPYLQGLAQLIVLTNDGTAVRSLCVPDMQSQLRIISLDPMLNVLIANWTQMLNLAQLSFSWTRQLTLRALFKLQLFRLTEYRAILFTDVDADPFLPSTGRPPTARMKVGHRDNKYREMERAWTRSLGRFLYSPKQLIASSDWSSPINTGVMLLKPRLSTFDEGVSVLRRGQFHPLFGFDRVGRPREALAHLTREVVWPGIMRTNMFRKNDWNFIGGHADQGLFVYLFLVRNGARRFEFPRNVSFRKQHNLSTMKIHHFHSGTKPWRRHARCPMYLSFMNHADARPTSHKKEFCWRLLTEKFYCLRDGLTTDACRECRRSRQASLCDGRKKLLCEGTEVVVF